MTGFSISGLPVEQFAPLFGRSDDSLAKQGVVRMIADSKPGYPCRVTLEDAEPGEAVLLLNYQHLPVGGPYRSSHAIFVRENATATASYRGTVPEQLALRMLSVRAFDANDMMVEASLREGTALNEVIAAMFENPNAAYLHVHNATRGCFAARVARS